MAISIIGPLNNVIYKTTTEIVDSEIIKKMAGVLNILVDSGFEVMENTLKTIQDLTKEETP